MEPLIRLRMLGSQLNDAETCKLIKAIFKKYGNEKIFSFLFNHYLTKYQQSGEHHAELSGVNGLISNILNVRKKADHDSNDEEQERPLIVINSMPSALIGESASYLEVKDYVNFSHCDRKVYTACYSPSRLVSFSHFAYNDNCDLNQFPSLQSLSFGISDFNTYMASHPNQKTFRRLNELDIAHFNEHNEDIDTFLSHKCFDFDQITTLKLTGLGNDHGSFIAPPYNFDRFIDFLSRFPNVTNLHLIFVKLTAFNEQNEKISKLFPKLTVFYSNRFNLVILRDMLLTRNSKQLVAVGCSDNFPNIRFPKLKELKVDAQDEDGEQCKNIIQNIENLEKISFEGSSSEAASGGNLNKLILALFKSSSKLKCLRFHQILNVAVESLRKIIGFVECALYETKDEVRHSLMLELQAASLCNKDISQFLTMDIPRLINAFDASKIQNFMVRFKIRLEDKMKCDDIRAAQDKWTRTHLYYCWPPAPITAKWMNVVISNKGCKINGYSPRWMLKNMFL